MRIAYHAALLGASTGLLPCRRRRRRRRRRLRAVGGAPDAKQPLCKPPCQPSQPRLLHAPLYCKRAGKLAADPWLAADKAQHFAFCLAVTAGAYLLPATRRGGGSGDDQGRTTLLRHRTRLLLGVGAGVAAGVLKEVGDVLQVGRRYTAAWGGGRGEGLPSERSSSPASTSTAPAPTAAAAAAAATLLQWWPGALSFRDLAADAAGVAAAVALLIAAETRQRRQHRRTPTSQQQLQQRREQQQGAAAVAVVEEMV